jgi:cytochrome P450
MLPEDVTAVSESLPTFPPRRTDPFAPPPEYAQWRAECPVKKVRFPNGQEVWAVTTHAGVRQLLSQHDQEDLTANRFDPHFPALRAGVGGGTPDGSNILYMDEPEHGRMRRMLAPVFTHRKAMAMREGIQDSVDKAIDEMIAAGPPVDLQTSLSLVIPSLVICQLLGVGYEHHPFFQSVTEKLLSRDTPKEEFEPLLKSLHQFVTDLIDKQAADPTDDQIIGHLLINHEPAGDITRAQIAGLAMLLIIAGHETTATTISMTLIQLLRTGQWDDLVADPTLAPKLVEECLRTQAIADNTALRLAKHDFELEGQTIRAGEGMLALLAAANHDPAVFPDATTLDPTRKNRQHVSLGYGVHVCLGQNVARVELDVVFQTLARRLPTLRLDCAEEDLDWKHDGFVFGVRGVPVRW